MSNQTSNDMAIFILETERDDDGFVPLIATRGEPGYSRTNWRWGNDRELAERLCQERNEKAGLSEKDVAIIIASTMSKHRNERRGWKATVEIIISYPGCEDDAPEDWFSELLSFNKDIVDWGYIRKEGALGYPQPIEIPDDYEEGELINVD